MDPVPCKRGLSFLPFYCTVYNDVNAPPPYYANAPAQKQAATNGAAYQTPHHYERPEDMQAGALPAKEQLPDGAMVDIIPPKEATNEKADAPVKFFHRRSQPNQYEVPEIHGAQRSATPEDEAELKWVDCF